ncbi:MAG TPA: hypothetical protein VGA69_09750 [Nitriliruptorales bacterium]
MIVVALVGALALGALTQWRYVLAPLLGLLILQWGLATLRSFRMGAYGQDLDQQRAGPEPVSADDRVLYWCEPCGAELVLVTRGADRPPRHCGQNMYERTELPMS